jgi:hypothetical protein
VRRKGDTPGADAVRKRGGGAGPLSTASKVRPVCETLNPAGGAPAIVNGVSLETMPRVATVTVALPMTATRAANTVPVIRVGLAKVVGIGEAFQ